MNQKEPFRVDAGYTKIPDDLSECMKDDDSSVNTVGWIIRIEKWGKVLLILLTIIGVAEAIGLGVLFGELSAASNHSFAVVPFLLMIGATLILDFIVYIVFQVIRLHLITQAELVNNTKMTAKLISYLADNNER